MAEESGAIEGRDVAKRIRAFVERQFPIARQLAPDDDDPLLERGVVDSLGILEMVQFMTREFSIEIQDEDLTPENFASVTRLADFVMSRQP